MSGHCGHTSGATVYLDPSPTPSGAIRCIGPFVEDSTSERQMRGLLQQFLTVVHARFPNCWVAWGAYEESPMLSQHLFPMIGTHCGFLPDLTRSSDSNHWEFGKALATHRSGLRVDFFDESVGLSSVDPELLHPYTLHFVVDELVRSAWVLAGNNIDSMPGSFRYSPNSLDWQPNPGEGARPAASIIH